MSTKTIVQQSLGENIPLQLLNGQSLSNEESCAAGPDCDSLQARQAQLNESQDEAQSATESVPAEAARADDKPQGTGQNNRDILVNKRQLRLNATQTLIGVLALAGFLAMLYPQLADHFADKKSLELAEWEAWKDFRDECRSLLSSAREIGPDCREALRQPLMKPPVSLDASTVSHVQNFSHAIRNVLEGQNERMSQRNSRASVLPMLDVSLIYAAILLPLSIALWKLLPRSAVRRSESQQVEPASWVENHIARLQPESAHEYAADCDLTIISQVVRKRVPLSEYMQTEEYLFVRKRSRSKTKDIREPVGLGAGPELLHLSKDPAPPLIETLEPEHEDYSPWLPVATGLEEESYVPPSSTYISTLELVLDKLKNLRHDEFAFHRVESTKRIWSNLVRSVQEPCPDGFMRWGESTKWIENLSASCSAFPPDFIEKLESATQSVWAISIPGFRLDAAVVVYAGPDLSWQLWQPPESDHSSHPPADEPCLCVVALGDGRPHILFDRMNDSTYQLLVNALASEQQSPVTQPSPSLEDFMSCPPELEDLQFILSLHYDGQIAHDWACTRLRGGGVMYAGRFVSHINLHNDSNGLIELVAHSILYHRLEAELNKLCLRLEAKLNKFWPWEEIPREELQPFRDLLENAFLRLDITKQGVHLGDLDRILIDICFQKGPSTKKRALNLLAAATTPGCHFYQSTIIEIESHLRKIECKDLGVYLPSHSKSSSQPETYLAISKWQWRAETLNQCPVKECGEFFLNIAEAPNHFWAQHNFLKEKVYSDMKRNWSTEAVAGSSRSKRSKAFEEAPLQTTPPTPIPELLKTRLQSENSRRLLHPIRMQKANSEKK